MHEGAIKTQIAKAAIPFVKNGSTIGLGTGSTASAFIEELAKHKLNVLCVASSHTSEALAISCGLHCVPPEKVSHVDMTFDGADEVDDKKRCIKGAGGALFREKILARASSELIILIEERKKVELLGRGKLPVEILPWGHNFTISHLEEAGYHGKLRKNSDGTLFVTENHNLIFDIILHDVLLFPEDNEEQLRRVPGIIETGLFLGFDSKILIGRPDGTVITLE
jgi:ribose 5-phosphate isomerase A